MSLPLLLLPVLLAAAVATGTAVSRRTPPSREATVAVVLWIVAGRPAVATRDDRIEAALRRASAHRVLRAAVAAVLVDTGGLLVIGGMAARVQPGFVAGAGVGAAVVGGLAVLAGVVVACTRAPVGPVGSPAVPVG